MVSLASVVPAKLCAALFFGFADKAALMQQHDLHRAFADRWQDGAAIPAATAAAAAAAPPARDCLGARSCLTTLAILGIAVAIILLPLARGEEPRLYAATR